MMVLRRCGAAAAGLGLLLLLHGNDAASVGDVRPWMDKADPPGVRAKKLVAEMKMEEKLVMLHGPIAPMPCCECFNKTTGKIVDKACAYTGNVVPNERLGIPPIHMNDGPQGFRENMWPGTTTAWPSSLTVAASWDPVATGKWGDGMGKEFFAKGANVQLGPGVCLARVPRNGRNFEYLSGEDPFLGHELVQPVIKGIQDNNVVANAKHYVNNNQETNRGAVSEIVDERTRFEMYYPPFAGAVKAGLGSIMCSYNKINGVWSCENPETLGNLKKDLGFQGWVMSDWGATHSTSIMAGLDQEMPGAADMNDAAINAGIAANNITAAAVDDSVTRILTGMFLAGVMDKYDEDKMAYDFSKHSANVTSESAAQLARELSANSTVLLKNEGGVLPLTASDKVAVIGLADQDNALTHGGGSGQVTPSWTITPLAGISAAAGKGKVTYDAGTDTASAVAAAKAADVAVVFVGSLSSEGSDRKSLSLDDGSVKSIKAQDALIEAVVAANPKTVVVLTVPGAILMPWSSKVAGIFINFMPGQQAGHAIADCMFGKTNPSGKLPLTMPNKENEQDFTTEQWPGLPDPTKPVYANYTEKLLVGYRYYDAKKIEFTTGFPFGHGLSYATFKYSDIKTSSTSISATVENTGKVAGSEVAQMYLGFPSEAGEPPKQLKGFKKVMLAPGASTTVEFPLTEWSTAIWDVESHGWKPVKGEFDVWVGTSSRELPLTAKLTM